MPGATDRTAERDRARAPLLIACAALFVILYLPVLGGLFDQWISDDNYQHGLLVPLISGLVLWQRRASLRESRPDGGLLPGALMIASAAVLLVGGTAASELFTTRLSIPLMIMGSLSLLFGFDLVRRGATAFLLLFMMIPLPYIVYYKVSFPLQLLSARLSAGLVRMLHVPIIRRGNILHLPQYTLEVVAACSGLRSLMTMITLSLVIAAFWRTSNTRKVLLVACSVPIAVAANAIRLVVTAVGAYAVDPAFADGPLHTVSGMIVFVSGLVMLLIAWGLLGWKRKRR